MATIRDDTNPVCAAYFAVVGGTFRLREAESGAGYDVLDDDGNVIGAASRSCYGASGFAVHTKPFAGFVPEAQIEYV
jgi:hypothetical protein